MIIPEDDHNPFQEQKNMMKIVDVPGSWNEYLTDHEFYGIKTNKIHYASRLYINGQQIGSSGTPSKDPKEYKGNLQMYVVMAPSEQKQMEIVFHIANGNYPTGGIVNSIDFGTAKGIEHLRDRNRAIDARSLIFVL